jgi:hypothetical protein
MNIPPYQRPLPAKILQILSILLIVLGLPLGMILPGWWGWENQPVENAQSAILICGLIHAILLSRKADEQSKWLWLAGIPLWFVLISREFSFGAVFLPPTSISAHGPMFSVNQLSYKPLITPVVLALILVSTVIIVTKRLAPLGPSLAHERRAPWLSLGLVVIGMLLSTTFEGHIGIKIPIDNDAAQTIEEITELGAYLALWAAQFEIFAAFASRRAG